MACDICTCQQPTHLPKWSSHFGVGDATCDPAHHSLMCPTLSHPHSNPQPPGIKSLTHLLGCWEPRWAGNMEMSKGWWISPLPSALFQSSLTIPGLLVPALTPHSLKTPQWPEGAWEHPTQVMSLLCLESSISFSLKAKVLTMVHRALHDLPLSPPCPPFLPLFPSVTPLQLLASSVFL